MIKLTLPDNTEARLNDNLVWECTEYVLCKHLNTYYSPLKAALSPADGLPGERQAREAAAALASLGAEVVVASYPVPNDEQRVY